MATRRPRIKPVANILLNSKRKPKPTCDVKPGNVGESDVHDTDVFKKIDVTIAQKECNVENTFAVRTEHPYETNASINNFCQDNPNKTTAGHKSNNEVEDNLHKVVAKEEKSIESANTNELASKNLHAQRKETPINDSDAFKCPPKVGFQRTISHTSNSGIDDVFYSDIEENALQMDLEKSPSNCPMSPSKNLARPRIKATPHFGQRRNSFVGSSPSPHTSANDDNHSTNSDNIQPLQTRRERHHSASNIGIGHSLHHHTPHKYLPAGITNSTMGRIRTESGCSVFSDTNTSMHKLRKTEDHKQSARKDFEARFQHGVPEKSAIKMSDLIFYNPATNPMEKKPKPNVKLEQNETSSNDVKPFTEIATDKLADDAEAVPVPQLKLNAKGELILDDKSLVIETTAEQEARKVLANSSLIYLDEYTGMNGFYSRKARSRDWKASDTIKFYRCLQNIGTDFSLMVTLFPNRTRRDLKLKFKSEEKKNNHLINKALLYPKQFDIEYLKEQMDEEDKLREVQVKDNKKKMKKEQKKINYQSKATRTLINGVYQNENNQEENGTNITTKDKNKLEDIAQTEKTTKFENEPVETEEGREVRHKESEKRIKTKKSKKLFKKLSEVEKLIKRDYDCEQRKLGRAFAMKRRRKKKANKLQEMKKTTFIKKEIKIENKQESNEAEFQDTKQLEMEMDDLLDMDAVDTQYENDTYTQYDNDTYRAVTPNAFPLNTSQVQQFNTTSPTIVYKNDENIENDAEAEKYEHRTFVNLDDGSLSVYSNIKDDIVFINSPLMSTQRSTSKSPTENENSSFESATTEIEIVNQDTCSSVASERELNEADIQSILTELADGSLVLVSSLDPDDPDKVLNEIYMVDKDTGDLCDEPLNIPDNIVQCILTVVS